MLKIRLEKKIRFWNRRETAKTCHFNLGTKLTSFLADPLYHTQHSVPFQYFIELYFLLTWRAEAFTIKTVNYTIPIHLTWWVWSEDSVFYQTKHGIREMLGASVWNFKDYIFQTLGCLTLSRKRNCCKTYLDMSRDCQ